MLIDKYTKSSMSQHTNQEEMWLSQRGGDRNKSLPPYNKKYWENIQCFIFLHKGHPVLHFTITIANAKLINKATMINQSKVNKLITSKTNKAASIVKLHSSQLKIKYAFTTLNIRIKDIEKK